MSKEQTIVQLIDTVHESDKDVRIHAKSSPSYLPDDVEQRVNDNWAAFTQRQEAAGRSAFDAQILYLVHYKKSVHSSGPQTEIQIEARSDGYRFNQWFNRDDVQGIDTTHARQYGFDCLANWILLTSDDDKALFGYKHHFGPKKVSGFGGFSMDSDRFHPRGKPSNFIDSDAWVQRILQKETGVIEDFTVAFSYIGLNFSHVVGPRGFDLVYEVPLAIPADEAMKIMEANEQFTKDLIAVPANPKDLVAFLNRTDIQPTTSCVGGVFQYIARRFPDDLMKSLAEYNNRVTVWPNFRTGEVNFNPSANYNR